MTLKVKPVIGAPIKDVVVPGPMTFSMIEKQALFEMDQLIASEPHAARILNHLIRLTEAGSGGVVVISRSTLASMLKVSVPTVARAISVLVRDKWVQRMKVGGAYALAVNRAVAWTGPRGEMERAVFHAVVVAGRAEQEPDALSITQEQLRRVPSRMPGEYVLPTGEVAPPVQELLPGTEDAPVAGADLPPDVQHRAALEARGQQRLTIDSSD